MTFAPFSHGAPATSARNGATTAFSQAQYSELDPWQVRGSMIALTRWMINRYKGENNKILCYFDRSLIRSQFHSQRGTSSLFWFFIRIVVRPRCVLVNKIAYILVGSNVDVSVRSWRVRWTLGFKPLSGDIIGMMGWMPHKELHIVEAIPIIELIRWLTNSNVP